MRVFIKCMGFSYQTWEYAWCESWLLDDWWIFVGSYLPTWFIEIVWNCNDRFSTNECTGIALQVLWSSRWPLQLGITQNWGTLNMGWSRWRRFVGPCTDSSSSVSFSGILLTRSIFLLKIQIYWGTLNPCTLSLRTPDSAMRSQARTPQTLSFRLAEPENQLSVAYSQVL